MKQLGEVDRFVPSQSLQYFKPSSHMLWGQKEDQETYMSSKKKRKLTAYSSLPHLQKTKQKIVKLKTRDARQGRRKRYIYK
jgi:hypothetical protein